jgi:hypothetical protein
MTADYEEFLKGLLLDIDKQDFLHAKDIPNIDLYMDQVTTFMDDHLVMLKRSEDQKILTKTMINNYSKDHLLPPSIKKKYTKDHMILLAMIYNLKQVLSITDIQTLLNPLKSLTNKDPKQHDLEAFFDTMTDSQINYVDTFSEQVMTVVNISQDLFKDIENSEQLSIISTVYLLSMQAAFQKYMATALIDQFLQNKPEEEKKEVKDKPIKEKSGKDKTKESSKDMDKEISKEVLKDLENIAKGKIASPKIES